MHREERSDWECVRRVQGGETEAFELLVRRHEKTVFNLLFRWLRNYDDAAEVAQEVLFSAYRSIKHFRGESSFSTWLYRIAVNHGKNRRKSLLAAEQRVANIEAFDSPNPGPGPAEKAEEQEIHNLVQTGLNSLSDDDALVILLHDLQDVPYEEMARVLEVPIGTVKSRLHRARMALKTRLAPCFRQRGRQDEV
jgi:RNA polymerase sigma-70 factor (ECF subfamily)